MINMVNDELSPDTNVIKSFLRLCGLVYNSCRAQSCPNHHVSCGDYLQLSSLRIVDAHIMLQEAIGFPRSFLASNVVKPGVSFGM